MESKKNVGDMLTSILLAQKTEDFTLVCTMLSRTHPTVVAPIFRGIELSNEIYSIFQLVGVIKHVV